MHYIFGITLIVAFLMARISEAGKLPQGGLLDGMPPNCTGMHYCHVKHDDYPQKQIDMLLTKKYKISLGDLHEQLPRGRDGGEDVRETCEKVINHGEIFEILDAHDKVRVVVQSQNFKQKIRVEKCAKPGPIVMGDSGPFGSEELGQNTMSCEEKAIEYSFLVLSQDGSALESIKSKYKIPVCCSCKILNPMDYDDEEYGS